MADFSIALSTAASKPLHFGTALHMTLLASAVQTVGALSLVVSRWFTVLADLEGSGNTAASFAFKSSQPEPS